MTQATTVPLRATIRTYPIARILVRLAKTFDQATSWRDPNPWGWDPPLSREQAGRLGIGPSAPRCVDRSIEIESKRTSGASCVRGWGPVELSHGGLMWGP